MKTETKKIKEIEFTRTEAEQMLAYLEERERENWYYGNQQLFQTRHDKIKEKIKNSLTT